MTCHLVSLQVVTMLLNAPKWCEINAMSHTNHTALCRACEGGHVEVVKLLLESRASHEACKFMAKLDAKVQPLVLACKSGDITLVSVRGMSCWCTGSASGL